MNELIPNKIFITARNGANRHMAVLAFDDIAFTRQLYRELLQNTGRSIRELGDLDLSHLL